MRCLFQTCRPVYRGLRKIARTADQAPPWTCRQAALRYSLIKPWTTCVRLILPVISTGWPGSQRASGCVRVRPLVLDDLPVPGEQGAGCHDAVQQKVPWQQWGGRGDHGAVGPVRFRAGDLAAEHPDLV